MRIELSTATTRRYHPIAGWLLLTALATTLTACEGGVVVAPTGASNTAAATATMDTVSWPEPAPFAGPVVTLYGCAGYAYRTPPFNIVITASRTVHLDEVTIQMVNGSNLGGPTVAFPQPSLANEFGNTVIAAGQRRLFRFHPQFPCGEKPAAYAANLGLVEPSGAMHRLTVSGPPE